MWLYRLNVVLEPYFLGLYWRLSLEGAKDSIPREGPLLVTANHASYLDPWFIAMAFPRHIHYLISRDWYERSRIWRMMFRAYGTEPVRPGRPAETVEAVCRLLSEGKAVGIFPEGRVSDDGRIQRFRLGMGRVAALSGAPVLPVGVRGAHRALPRHGRVPRPTRVTIHVGEPMTFPGSPMSELPPRCERSRFRSRVFETICALAGQDDHPALVAPAVAPVPGDE